MQREHLRRPTAPGQHHHKQPWRRGGWIELVDAIPKSPTGKILKRVLRDE